MDEILSRILNKINFESLIGDEALPLVGDQTPVPISLENFKKIPVCEENKTISFIDGGNAEIVGSSSFSLQLIRVARVDYKGKKKISSHKHEFKLLVDSENGVFSVFTDLKNELCSLKFNSFDRKLTKEGERATASTIASICRRISELKLASKTQADFVVLDGDLYPKSSQEEIFLGALKKKSVLGLSKTSKIMTKNGLVMSAALNNLKKNSWIYEPVFDGGSVNTVFARMHDKSNYVFRVDSFGRSESMISNLVISSRDPVFLGYPYGLIEADRIARISNSEVSYLKTKLKMVMGGNWRKLENYSNSNNAHDILDSIS